MSADTRPIGILPGSVPDDPAIPAHAPAPSLPPIAAPLSARAAAASALQLLTRCAESLERLVMLRESSVRNFIGSGSVAGGGTIGTTPQTIMQGNPRRRGLSVQNTGAGALTIGLGTTQPQPGAGLVLPPNSSWDGRISGAVWKGSVAIVGSQAGVTYSWLEVAGDS